MPPLPWQFASILFLSNDPSAPTHGGITPFSLFTFLSKHGLKKGEPLGANQGRKEPQQSFPSSNSEHVHGNLLPTRFH